MCFKLLVYVYVWRELLNFFLLNMRYNSFPQRPSKGLRTSRILQKDLQFSTCSSLWESTNMKEMEKDPSLLHSGVSLSSSESKEWNQCTFRDFEHDMKCQRACKLPFWVGMVFSWLSCCVHKGVLQPRRCPSAWGECFCRLFWVYLS